MTEREAALVKAARQAQRQEDAEALEKAAIVLAERGYSRTAMTLVDAAQLIRAGA